MFACTVCGNTTSRSETVSEIFHVDGRRVLVEGIPAQVCERCGEAAFSTETTERIGRLVHESAAPHRTIPLEVYAPAS